MSASAALGAMVCLLGGCPRPAPGPGPREGRAAPEPAALTRIQKYIRAGWTDLTRSHRNLLASFQGPSTGKQRILYYSSREREDHVRAQLRAAGGAAAGQVLLRQLPGSPGQIDAHGLLYLPHPYVVPGGRFLEMYGWDSYFILRGLVRDGRIRLARGMVDNFLYEIEHYGFILNANRTYFLTRSQPPFLTRMILALPETAYDRAWLERATRAAKAYYAFWAPAGAGVPLRHVAATGLARYWDNGHGPAPEVAADRDAGTGETHYDRVRAYYRRYPRADLGYDLARFYDAATDRLTEAFYLGDRAMRESGFDPSDRFGRFSVDIVSYHPVELNVLLAMMEQDLGALHQRLGSQGEADAWRRLAAARAARIGRLLWDDSAGLFLDWHQGKGRRSRYPFLTTFFPLWAGLASPEQARRVACNLPLFERPGGLEQSPHVTGSQWDAPFVWAPTHLVAVEGLRRYGFREEARRLSMNYLSLVLAEFERTGTVVEKYDARRRTSQVRLTYGYTTQEIGFGWTNAAFVVLLDGLDPADRHALGSTGFRPLAVSPTRGCGAAPRAPNVPEW